MVCAGSSPLARGLQCGIPTGPHHGRIIPARAGFTPSAGHRAARGEDHPRSRGVYVLARVHKLAGTGSSPLARGLRGLLDLHEQVVGIIPARAGFTSRRPWRRPPGRDHPRSRGVYETMDADSIPKSGSSPLARGLPIILPRIEDGDRIIPARAGFTVRRPGTWRNPRDHPRSRGVYFLGGVQGTQQEGSSPLARGLLAMKKYTLTQLGIIPARAGFTGGGFEGCAPTQDHPRSRGVYT